MQDKSHGYAALYGWTQFSEYIPRSGVAWSYSRFTFGLMRHLHGDAHKGCIHLHLTSSDYVFPLLGTLASRCVLFFSWCCSFWQVTWNPKVVIICNFMMVKAVEQFYLFIDHLFFSSENSLFSSIAHSLIRRSGDSLLRELYLNRSLFTLDISYQAQLTNVFSPIS